VPTVSRAKHPVRSLAIGAVVLAAVAYGLFAVLRPGAAQIQLTADFAETPGLYKGNSVDVLGIPVGHITGIHPGAGFVRVTMVVPHSLRVPADAQAVITAPNVVNDRYVELQPAYTGGARIADHAVIPMNRTAAPVSVDQIVASLDSFAKALGPNGANAHGALSALVANLARTFGTNGPEVNSAIQNLGKGLGALSSDGPALTALIDNLGSLTSVASHYTSQYETFATDLASVSTDLAGDDSSLAGALSNLQQALGQLASFIQQNSSALSTSVGNLSTFSRTIASEQQELAKTFGMLPTALQNLDAAFDTTTPGGPTLKARFDPVAGSKSLATSVCGSSLLRLLLVVPSVATTPDPDAVDDLDCGVNGVLAQLPVPPGASSGPDLSLSSIFGAGS
jgi:virulence factor Mce-like protein